MGAYGADTFRVWSPSLGVATPDGNGEYTVTLDGVSVAKYRTLIDRLKLQGVKQIVMMPVALIPMDFPIFVGVDGNYYTQQQLQDGAIPCDVIRMDGNAWPEANSEEYDAFLSVQKEYFRLLSAALPGITHFEGINEPDHTSGQTLHKIGWLTDEEVQKLTSPDDYLGQDAYKFTIEECAQLSMDFNYSITQGVEAAGTGAKVLAPALTVLDTAKTFLEEAYSYISDSDNYFKDTDTDHYFTILNWHPYVLESVYTGEGELSQRWTRENWEDNWVAFQNSLYQIAEEHGDGGKKVWFTEFGVSDRGTGDETAITEEMTATRMQDMYDIIKTNLPFVDTVIVFRLFDKPDLHAGPYEANFGMFEEFDQVTTSEAIWKPIGKALFQIINGQDADGSSLMKIVDKYYQIHKGTYEFKQTENFEEASVFRNTFITEGSDITVSYASGHDYFLTPKLSMIEYNGGKALAADYKEASSNKDYPKGYMTFQLGRVKAGTYQLSFVMDGAKLDDTGYWGTTYLGVTSNPKPWDWLDGVMENNLAEDGIILYKDGVNKPIENNTFTFTVTEEMPQLALTFQVYGKLSENAESEYSSEGSFRVIFDDIALTKINE